MDLRSVLHRTIPLVLRAGGMIRAEFLRADGPRGSGHKAPVDTEIEIFLRDALRDVLPARFVGEETPPVLDGDPSWCWLADPHDGTSEFLRGARGSSVSVALLHDGVPVLGVVHAPLSPDRGSDLIGWAEGMDHLLRDGVAIRPEMASHDLTPEDGVLLAYRSYARPETNMRRVAPARFVSSNSVAYRLARVAAGDAVATASRQSRLSAYDYAAGHALLRGANCILVDGAGNPPVYGPDGTGGMDKCFAGAPAAVRALLGRDWSLGEPPETPLAERVSLGWPRTERGLDRAIGCLLGLAIGEGSAPDGLPGQAGPGTELALALARVLLAGRGWEAAAVSAAYRSVDSAGAVQPILRCAPLAIGPDACEAARLAAADARLTHSEPADELACGAFAAAIATGVGGGSPEAMMQSARAVSDNAAIGPLRSGFLHLTQGTPIARIAGTDAIAGALLGAAGGRAALPADAVLRVLSCRPLAAFGARRPRPPECWADDLPLLAEALLSRAR